MLIQGFAIGLGVSVGIVSCGFIAFLLLLGIHFMLTSWSVGNVMTGVLKDMRNDNRALFNDVQDYFTRGPKSFSGIIQEIQYRFFLLSTNVNTDSSFLGWFEILSGNATKRARSRINLRPRIPRRPREPIDDFFPPSPRSDRSDSPRSVGSNASRISEIMAD